MIDTNNDLQLASGLRTVVSRLMKKLRNKSSASENLSLTERSVLKMLDECKELQPGDLALMEKITAQSMSQILNHLTELGYITRKVSDTDRRKVFISLTKAGQKLLYKTRSERDEWLNRAIAETLTAREQELLKKVLEPLTRLTDYD